MLNSKKAKGSAVNLKMLYLHATAFGLFIVSESFYMAMSFMIAFPWRPYLKHDTSLFIFGGIATSIATFSSQAMVSLIMYGLAKKRSK